MRQATAGLLGAGVRLCRPGHRQPLGCVFRACRNGLFTRPRGQGSPLRSSAFHDRQLALVEQSALVPQRERCICPEIIGRDDEISVVERFNLVTELLFVLPDDHPLKNRSPIDVFWSELSRSVRLRPGIRAEAQDWLDQHRDGAPVIGIHMRLSSNEKAFESLEQARPNLGSALQALDRFVDQHRDGRIFVMTDYQPYIEDLKRRYPGRVISRPVARLDEQNAGLRQLGLGAPTGNFGLAAEVVRDIATASLCDCFIGDGASSVSLVIAGLGGWTPDRLTWTRAPNVLGNRWAEFLTPPRHAQPERTFFVHGL